MRKLLFIGVFAAAICLAALYVIFNYPKPAPSPEQGAAKAGGNSDEAPAGYFDLRGIKQVLIDIRDASFNPQRIFVSPDTEILWKNGGKLSRSVVFDSQPASPTPVLNSAQLKTGELFVRTIHNPGTYTYHSSDNPDTMTGIVVVK